MDRGRRLTTQQKERRRRFLVLFAVFLILDFALWLCFGKQDIFPLIGCGSAVIFALSCVYLGIYYGVLSIFQRNGRRFTCQVIRKLKILFWAAYLFSVGFTLYLLYVNMPQLKEFFCRITSSIPVPEIKLDHHFPKLNYLLPDLCLDFWHIAAALVCLGVVIASFCSQIWCGIISMPVMAAYGILFWRACDGNYPGDFAAYIELLKYAVILMLVSGLLVRNLEGFVMILSMVRFLVPFTLLSVVAVLLQNADPLGSPPLNFRAVLFWVLALAFFAAQSFQLFGCELPEYTGPERVDNPVAEQSGDEYEESAWR